MNASESRELSKRAGRPVVGSDAMQLAYNCWQAGIYKAASHGRYSVRRSELNLPRTPIAQAAWDIAAEWLDCEGFKVTADEVSWLG